MEESLNTFDDSLPINSIQNLKKFEEKIEITETKANFVNLFLNINNIYYMSSKVLNYI